MWTIGRSQRVEEKKYRPIVRKIRYICYKAHHYAYTVQIWAHSGLK